VALSVVLITYNEEANLRRTLESVQPLVRNGGEIIVLDNGSTDRTVYIAREFDAKVFVEDWKGYAAQKNSAIAKATCEWVLSLDADEAVDRHLAEEIGRVLGSIDVFRPEDPPDLQPAMPLSYDQALGYGLDEREMNGFSMRRKNFFLGRWIKHAGFWPDRKLRLFRRGKGRFIDRPVHEVMEVDGTTGTLKGALLHQTYPTLSGYIDTMNRYSSLGAEIAVGKGQGRFSLVNIVLRPLATFCSMYVFRLGFLDGREGLLLCLYHSVYVSWKYAKAWELARASSEE
jgi:glycosyltransferase involved in cell wall biosynthesis